MEKPKKNHYVTLQLGPVNLKKNERVMVLGLITTMLNGILENTRHPQEAASFIEYFLRERLEKEDIKMLQQLEVYQRSKITIALENEASFPAVSLKISELNHKRGFNV